MTLEEKGNIVPPIQLNEPMESVSKAVQSWKDVISATHWDLLNATRPDGADFYVGNEELGHIHVNGALHLATSLELQEILVKRKLASKFPYGEGWVQYSIRTKKDAKQALFLFDVNYQRLMGVSFDSLLKRISEYSND